MRNATTVRWALGLLGVVLAVAVVVWAGLPDRPERPPLLVLDPADFDALPGWEQDDHAATLATFLASCPALERRSADTLLGLGTRAGDWARVCVEARDPAVAADPRAFFERTFRVYALTDRHRAEGLFTGYYEPLLNGSLTREGPFQTALYAVPDDMVTADLGAFGSEYAGKRLVGRVVDGRFVPYPDRAAIDGGHLDGRGHELVWVDDAVEAFFLHIQGSGRVRLPDGSTFRVGYAAQNGLPYTAIGRTLIERGAIARENMSMQAIRAWLKANPGDGVDLMRTNRSYVFFRQVPSEAGGPLGALDVGLTAMRSLAVDRTLLPLGAPVFLDVAMPDGARLRRLFVAQDTGGAIRGPVRGDVFVGSGDEAGELAGRMAQKGRAWILLPRTVTPQ